jgi:nucleotide-binding universal stress UspA family protein
MTDRSITHILVATDFSENAALALRWAMFILAGQGRISLVHAMDGRAVGPKTSLETVTEEVQQHLRVAGDPARVAGLEVSEHVEVGKSWNVIAGIAQKVNADLIVMGTHGQSSLGEYVLGSTADRVIRIATKPAMAVHPHDQLPQAHGTRILVAHDFSKQADAAAKFAVELLRQVGGGELTLFNVCELVVGFPASSPTFDQTYWETCEADARKKLQSIAGSIQANGINVNVKTSLGAASNAIVDEAKSTHSSLIVMGTHGGSAIHQLIVGSVAERVLQSAPCPVLTVRTPA